MVRPKTGIATINEALAQIDDATHEENDPWRGASARRGELILLFHLFACDPINFEHTERKQGLGTVFRGIRKTESRKNQGTVERVSVEKWSYPTGMVWCPMKMSGMALMKCAEMQKQFGCGSLKEFRIITNTKPENAPFFWPWLRRRRECPERASDQEVRDLRLVLTPLKLVEKSRKNPRVYCCPTCGGRKAFGARQCRRCWHATVGK